MRPTSFTFPRQVIDPEFAFYGPMGFDLGALVGNLLLAYCAVPGNGQGEAYAEWLLEQVQPHPSVACGVRVRSQIRRGCARHALGCLMHCTGYGFVPN